jgi:hypothetical protein
LASIKITMEDADVEVVVGAVVDSAGGILSMTKFMD